MYDSAIESRKMGRGEWQKSVLSPDDAAIADSNSPVVKARKSATSLPCLPSSGCNRSPRPSVSPSNISSFLSGRLARRQARTASYPLTLPLPSRSNSFLAKTFRTDSYLVRFFLPLLLFSGSPIFLTFTKRDCCRLRHSIIHESLSDPNLLSPRMDENIGLNAVKT